MYWLQLVKTPDSHLSGQLEQNILNEIGKIEHATWAISGASDGSSVTFSATTLGFQIFTLSGSLEGERLVLTGGQPSPMIFVRSDLREYQAEIDSLNGKAQGINASKANADFLSQIDGIVSRMRKFNAEADGHLSTFPEAEERIHAITTKISEYVNRERQLARNPNAAVTRGQLNVAAYQASNEAEQLHNSAQSLERSIATGSRSIAIEFSDLRRGCKEPNLRSLTHEQIRARAAACDQLVPAAGVYKQRVETVVRGLSRFEQVYAEESKTQRGLLQLADRLE